MEAYGVFKDLAIIVIAAKACGILAKKAEGTAGCRRNCGGAFDRTEAFWAGCSRLIFDGDG